jgi:anaerobic selenocysteine-containing dehydrogenase
MMVKSLNHDLYHNTCSECYMYCGVRTEVSGGKATRIIGDPEDPVYRGGVCVKGKQALEVVYSPHRVLYPMRKVGPREGGRWERISWPDALATVADRLEEVIKRHGPKAVVAFTGYPGTSRCIMSVLFTRSLGSPDIVATTPLWCEGPGIVADSVTVGGPITHFAYHDLENTRCVLLWGTNPQASHPPLWAKILRVKGVGAKLIVVDPRRTPAVAKADIWLPIRPGTDGALTLGMINVIIDERLYDEEFVEKWCFGFEQLRDRVRRYPVDRVAEITGLPRDAIVEAARIYATTKPACMFARNGITRKPNATQTCRGITILIALTGNIDIPGGNFLPKRVDGFISRGELFYGKKWRLPQGVEAQALGAAEFPLWAGPEGFGATSHNSLVINEILSEHSRIKAAIVTGNNVVLNTPDPMRVREAFRRLEFIFSVDCFLTPTTELADIFLPAVTWVEREELAPDFFSLHVTASQQAIAPLGETWDDNRIFIELAKLMRYRGLLPYDFIRWASVEEFHDYCVKGLGITFEGLKKKVRIPIPVKHREYEPAGFKTPTGKVELYSTIFERYGYAPVPEYHELPESPLSTPDLRERFPLILITPRQVHYFNSRQRQSSSLRKVLPEATVEIHRVAAEERGIKNGDWVWVETRYGKCRQRAVVTENLPLDVAAGSNYWWYPEKPRPLYGCHDHNLSLVIPDGPHYDRIEGTPWLVGYLCRITKAEGAEAR